GVAGEIYISGAGIARGYLNQPEMTNSKFQITSYKQIPNSKSQITNKTSATSALSAVKIYKTGDLGRLLPDGNIEFIGRIDNQVKIRGYRIELGEIENRLSQQDDVSRAVVVARTDDPEEAYICAYIVPVQGDIVSASTVAPSMFRDRLAKELPDYMIPQYFVMVEAIPLTSNGKIDHDALPAPEIRPDQSYTAPRTVVETKLVEIWSQVLKRDLSEIGTDVNFFELGGQSLKATILVSRIHKQLNVMIPLNEIFRTPTIMGLARYIHTAALERYAAILPVEKREYYVLSSAQKRLYILNRMDSAGTAYNMPQFIPLDQPTSVEKLRDSFVNLIHRHESLRTSFHMI
ncbi:MAG: AMP-binding protein, partial [bacterium]|nr:AMP-binding protein [bacterium]